MVKLKTTLIALGLTLFLASSSIAQCAMCRATLETNVSNGSEEHMASTLNIGILYLFAAPYVLVGIVGYMWYRQSRKPGQGYQ